MLGTETRKRVDVLPDTIGGEVHISRPETERAIESAIDGMGSTAVLGRSGSGKSVLLKSLAQKHASSMGGMWFDATLFGESDNADIEQRIGLNTRCEN